MKQKAFLAFIFFALLLLGSCRDTSAIKNEISESGDNDINNISQNDSISKILPTKNDSIACYLDSIIGRFHVKHFTTNDSTGKCVLKFTLGEENKLDSIVHYDRKLHIYIGDGNYVFKKTITREELCKIAEQEEYETLCIRYVDVKLLNDSSLLYHIGLEEEDNWSISFDYVYSNKKFLLKKYEYHAC